MDKSKETPKAKEEKSTMVEETKPQIINLQEVKKETVDFDKLPKGTVIVDEVKQ